jgi:hypothetical protein
LPKSFTIEVDPAQIAGLGILETAKKGQNKTMRQPWHSNHASLTAVLET